VTTIVAALIGAFIGSVGAKLVEAAIASRTDVRRRRRAVAVRYLFQLQDAAESLWYRLDNAAHHGAKEVTTDAYLRTSSLYALGRVLCLERILVLEGGYSEIAGLDKRLAAFLIGEGRLDFALGGIRFMQYDRLALAEATLEREEGAFRPSTYLEFRERLDTLTKDERPWLRPAEQGIVDLLNYPKMMRSLLGKLEAISHEIAPFTGLASSLDGKSGRAGAQQMPAN
jgi:hypothetical protein